MKVIVTGGAGFIGSHLCEELLENGHEVYIVDNFDPFYPKERKQKHIKEALKSSSCHLIEGDLRHSELYSQLPTDADIIVHLAAKAGVRPSIENPSEYISSNFTASNNLLNWMKDNKINKLVFASSSSVYGNNKQVPFSEAHNVDNPISPYAFTKKACELMNFTYHNLYQIDVINLRFFTVYGERQRPDLAIHKFIKKIKNGESIELYGDGGTARDYTYVKDTVKGIVQSMNYVLEHNNVYEIINLGKGEPVKLSELVDTIYEILDTEKQIVYMPMQPGDVDITYCDTAKAKKLLNYSAETSLKQGIRNFIQKENI